MKAPILLFSAVSALALSACSASEDAGSSGSVSYGPDAAVPAGEIDEAAGDDVGANTRMVLGCYARAYDGDPDVYDDCFTEDYKMTGPETRMISTTGDGASHGRDAIKAYHDMNHGDAVAWGDVRFQRVWSMEAGDKVVRLMRWTSADPVGTYGTITNIPADRTVVAEGIFVDTIRDGKISDNWFTYDTMHFLVDIAGGDFQQAGEGLAGFGAMMEAGPEAMEAMTSGAQAAGAE